MEKIFSIRLKKILILAVVLNFAIIIMQGLSAVRAVETSKKSLMLVGRTALSSFEGGRRARMLLNGGSTARFRPFIDTIGEDTGVVSLYLFDNNGEILLNTKNVTPPVTTFAGAPHGIIDTPDGFFMFRLLPTSRQMGSRMMHYEDERPLIAGVMLDKAVHKSIVRAEISFMSGMLLLEALLIAIYVYTARILRINTEQTRRLEASEREAELGKMSRVMAHELKNPLSTVKGLMEYSAGKSEGRLKEIAESCVEELSRLDRIINDYLSYGKDITLSLTDTDIMELTGNTVKLLQIDAQEKSLSISVTGSPAVVNADCEKMRQVIFNLLINAIQGAPAGSTVHIAVSQDEMSVVNEISSRDFEPEHIGEPFYTTKTVGTGLGLAIVKRIAGLHGFGVDISTEDKFAVTIKFRHHNRII
jgi:two-component system sensor histidine kinase HydH